MATHSIFLLGDGINLLVYTADLVYLVREAFVGGSDRRESACNAADLSSIPGSGRSPGEGRGNPLQYSCLENPMDRGAWRGTVYGVAKSWSPLSD